MTANGNYQVTYSTTVTTSGTATPPVTVSVQLENGGVAVPGTIASTTLTTAGNTANLSGNAVIQVTAAPATLTLNATDTDGSFTNTAITVRKLD